MITIRWSSESASSRSAYATSERARRFYETLGWTAGAEPGDDVVFFQAGGMVVALWGRDKLAEDAVRPDGGGWGGDRARPQRPLAGRR
jgi:hypothetical protein